jgi:hypothetical protein
MTADDLTLLVMGGTLTLLALVSGYFIMLEVAQFVRELGGGRRGTFRQHERKNSPRKPGDTGPLKSDNREEPALRGWTTTETIQPIRDADVVRQLIEHLKDDTSPDPGGG